jgi:uncharacterized protein YqhQ
MALVGGVHLSNGTVGTASTWRLALSGLAFPLVLLGAAVFTFLVLAVIQKIADRPLIALWVGSAANIGVAELAAWQALIRATEIVGLLVSLRLSPLSGYHSAEHKVVHAIERFGYVTKDLARRMPRAHPRCGTCLLAPLMIMWIALPFVHPYGYVADAFLLMTLWMLRTPLGSLLQTIAATKEPTEKQLRAGLEAGRRLLHLTRSAPGRVVSPLRRLWNRGMFQYLGAALLTFYVVSRFVQHHWLRLLDW